MHILNCNSFTLFSLLNSERAAPFKQLAGGIEFVNEIPKSASGKILRRYLRDDYKEKYGKN